MLSGSGFQSKAPNGKNSSSVHRFPASKTSSENSAIGVASTGLAIDKHGSRNRKRTIHLFFMVISPLQEVVSTLKRYKKIRKNARNGLAVVSVERDACGGCFNKIPPQRQLDIRSRKKIIVCEYCGRILVDKDIVEEEK